MDMYDPNAQQGLLQTSGQVGGNAANIGAGYGTNIRSAGIGKQDAFQKLAMLRIMQGGARNKTEQDFQNQMRQQQFQNQQATPFDFLGAGISGLGALSGWIGRNKAYDQLGIKRKSAIENIFG